MSTRAAYFETEAPSDPLREVAWSLGLDAPLFPWLTLRAHADTFVPLPDVVEVWELQAA